MSDSRLEPIVRPASGWLRTLREALGLTLADLANRLKVTPPAVRSFEQAESEDRITLASLRRSADAMGCDLVYTLIPRTGTLANAAARIPQPARAEIHVAPSAVHVADASASKVLDKTWHALHGDP